MQEGNVNIVCDWIIQNRFSNIAQVCGWDTIMISSVTLYTVVNFDHNEYNWNCYMWHVLPSEWYRWQLSKVDEVCEYKGADNLHKLYEVHQLTSWQLHLTNSVMVTATAAIYEERKLITKFGVVVATSKIYYSILKLHVEPLWK